ncbi:subtilase-type protease inhibitor [Streptomyces sp. NPDC006314]|uniref:subtilase-type protease inhibitor n=1 Tax=Streptomyces sp. NPDC006314 TaxID=3154475 RepID=UPI0033ADAB48
MHSTTRWATAGALLATALSAPLSTPAHGAPASLYAPAALVLTVGHGENAAETVPERVVTVSCAPTASGTHPDTRKACAELAQVGGDFDRLATLGGEGGQRYCTKEYRPVVVTAQGVWRGKRVNYARTFGNACIKEAQGASVFAF